MKLLLTSNGLTNQKLINNFVELAGDTKTKKLLCVTTGPDNLKINGFIKEALKPFIEAGIHRKNVKIYYLCKEDSVNVNEFDIILVCGGNTYDYLRMIKDWGLDKGIIKFIKQDKLYIGISAGSNSN